MARMSRTQTQPATKPVADVKSPSQDAIAEYNNKQQEKASKVLVDTNAAENKATEDSEANAVVAAAMEIGEELSKHPEFENALQIAVDAKKEDNYKSINMLALMERFLSSAQMANLPPPGSTKSQAELAASKLPPDKRPNMLVYDTVDGSGGRKGKVSFFKTLVLATKSGKLALATKQALEQEEARAKLVKDDSADQPRPLEARETDDEDETSAINQMLSAVRTAAKLRIQLEKIKKLKNIEFQWVRDEYEGSDKVPSDYDPTHLNIVGMGPVKKSTKVLWFKNKSAPTKEPLRTSVGQFLRWNISEDMLTREYANLGGDKGLIESAKKKPEAIKPGSVPKARDVANWTQLVENLDAIVSYEIADQTKQQGRYAEFRGSIGVTDDTLYSAYALYKMLRATFDSDPTLEPKAIEIHTKRNAK